MATQHEYFSPLPAGCSELCRTRNPDSSPTLEQHLDDLPTLTRFDVSRLNTIAVSAGDADGDTVLGASDLLRRRSDGSHSLHPRVIQLLSPDAVDPTLTHLVECVAEPIGYAAYQYPSYLVEYHEESGNAPTLLPSVYSIDVLDAVRDLRANDLLVSIRPKNQCPHDRSTLKRIAEMMTDNGRRVEGVATLVISNKVGSSGDPVLCIHDQGGLIGRRSLDELLDLCRTVKRRFLAPLTIHTASEYEMSADH